MMLSEKAIQLLEKTERTVPIYINGEQTSSQRQGWMLCHGYGQRADHLLQKWNEFDASEYSLVSVEAPHRFYWEGVTGRPVASWMTSRLRKEDIRDNNDYLDKIWSKYVQSQTVKGLFGFSQGGTTLWRWIHDRQPEFDVFVNYAGWIPEDIDLSILGEYLNGKKLIFVYGDTDQYLTPDRIAKLHDIVSASGLTIEIQTFQGDHRIDRKVLKEIIQRSTS